VQFVEKVLDVVLDGRDLDAQLPCDLLIREVMIDETYNLPLASGELGRGGYLQVRSESSQPTPETPGLLRRAVHFAACSALDRCDQILEGAIPRHVFHRDRRTPHTSKRCWR
jgi:hypothetical protein